MMEAIKQHFPELLFVSLLALIAVCSTVGLSLHEIRKMEHELEMAKIGCVEKLGPGGYGYWECNKKDEQNGP